MPTSPPEPAGPSDRAREEFLRLLNDGSVGAAFQPIVDLKSSVVRGWEALARDVRETPLFNAMDLVDQAREFDLLNELTWTVAKEAHALAHQAAVFFDEQMIVTINTELEQLYPGNPLFDQVAALDWPANAEVILEITERGDGTWHDGFEESARSLSENQIGIAIDDFGAGSARLTFLSHPSWAFVKLDRNLVTADGVAGRIVMTHTSRMFDELGVPTLAEGIETPDQLERAKSLGIGLGQGYLLGRPSSAQSFLDVLSAS